MTDITIPPEALEAAARALREEVRRALNVEEPDPPEGPSPSLMEAYRSEALAAALALLENWPGANRYSGCLLDQPYDHIILPLPEAPQARISTESSDED